MFCHFSKRGLTPIEVRSWLVFRRQGSTSKIVVSPMRAALEGSSGDLVGVGQLAVRMPSASFPLPKPFGLHLRRGSTPRELLQACTIDARVGFSAEGNDLPAHCTYAVQYEFPWLPLFAHLEFYPEIKSELASAITSQVQQTSSPMSKRWWFTYEQFFEDRLPLHDVNSKSQLVPWLPPERFFCLSTGKAFVRYGVIDNLLGDIRQFCPFVEKFAGAIDASKAFKAELSEVLSPICMMTIKDFLQKAGLAHNSKMTMDKFQRLLDLLVDGGFTLTDADRLKLQQVFGVALAPGAVRPREQQSIVCVVEFADWLRSNDELAARLREHVLGVTPPDVRIQMPGESLMDRLSRVISCIETRASQMIENELPPERKERYFVDVISSPWSRKVKIDKHLILRLQKGLLSPEKFKKVIQTQVDGEPRRFTQNWISSEEYDDLVGKEKVVHHMPPPPSCLPELLDGYLDCVNRMLADSNMDPIVCATIAKIGFNVLHPLVDGNGRVQRLLFQLVLFKFHYLPRMNVPVSVVMLQDRSGYESLQQKHVDQVMAGVSYKPGKSDVGEGGDDFQHVDPPERVAALYKYQDFTFATSSMMKLMEGTLPVIAAKAYFLQRFDWRVDELLKGDALLPARAATKIAKAFKNDGTEKSLSWFRVAKLMFLDGWTIGFLRILRFLKMAMRPDESFGFAHLRRRVSEYWMWSERERWIMASGQVSAASSTARVRWVAISLKKFLTSEIALKRALAVSKPGDTVVAVHYPAEAASFSMDLFPQLAEDIKAEVVSLRDEVMAKVHNVVATSDIANRGIEFRAFVGWSSTYKQAYALCQDAKVASVAPFRIYVGYDQEEHSHKFTDYVVRHAPCDIAVIKQDVTSNHAVRWVGISARNFEVSGAALVKAFYHSSPGDTVLAVYYPVKNPFEEEGLSSVYYQHLSSVTDPLSSLSSLTDPDLHAIADSVQARVIQRANQLAAAYQKDGVIFKTFIGIVSSEPHLQLVRDANTSEVKPTTVYVGYSRRRDHDRLVDPHKLYDVAEYIVQHAPCNVVVVKETQEAMAKRLRTSHGRKDFTTLQ